MTEPASRTTEPLPLGCAGITALMFAASPTISLVLLSLFEFQQHRGQPQGGGPVGFGVPPGWFIWLILLGVSVPWIVAGLLLLRGISVGRGIALLLTIPTAILTVLAGIGTLMAMNARDQFAGEHVRAFGPMAFFGMIFCLTMWVMEYSFWIQRRENQVTAPKTPPSES